MTDALWFRRLVLAAAAIFILGLGWSLAVRMSPAEETVEDRLASFDRTVVPPEENAAQWLLAGAAAVVWSEDDLKTIGEASNAPYEDWDPTLQEAVRDALYRQRGALETLHNAAVLELSSYGVRYRDGADTELPDLLSLVKACRLLLAEARVAAADGDQAGLMTALATMGRLADSLGRESTLITALVGVACERMMLRAAAEALTAPHPFTSRPEFLDAIEDTLATEDLLATMHRVFDAWTLVEQKALIEGSHGASEWADAGVTRNDIVQAGASLHTLVNTPYGRAPDRFEDDPPGEPLGMVMDNVRQSIPRAQAAIAQRQLVTAGIELRRAALRAGAYPTDPSEIPEVVTPDPFTGRPLAYSVEADGSATVALAGADELLEQVVLKSAAVVPPLRLPAP